MLVDCGEDVSVPRVSSSDNRQFQAASLELRDPSNRHLTCCPTIMTNLGV